MGKSRRIDYRDISFLIYAIISLILTVMHEPFKNEAQAWLIVRDLDLPGIINIMWYEGTPALWHLLLFPLVKLGLPYFSMQLMHWIFAIIIVWLMLYKSPFPAVLRVLFSFSYYFLYEYSAIARNYNITILLMFLLATLWKRKQELPFLFCLLVVLVINTNLIIWGFGVMVALLFFYDCKWSRKRLSASHLITILILVAGFALMFFQIIPREQASQHSVVSFSFFDLKFPEMVFRAPANAIISVGGDPETMVIPVFFFLCSTAALFLLIKKVPIFLATLFSSAWCIYMFMFIYSGGVRHHGYLLIIFIFFFWIKDDYHDNNWVYRFVPKYLLSDAFRHGVTLIIALCLVTSVLRMMSIIPQEIRYEFSGSKEIAQYIEQNDLEAKEWIGFRSDRCESILPYFADKKFWYAGIQDYGSYVVWNTEFKQNAHLSSEELIARINLHFPGRKDLLLILSIPLDNPETSGFELIYQNQKKVFWLHDETYFLYLPIDQ
jgi:hypothetical protein